MLYQTMHCNSYEIDSARAKLAYLTGEGAVAVQQHPQVLDALVVAAKMLLCTHLAAESFENPRTPQTFAASICRCC